VSATDNITRVTTPTFTGAAEGGATVTLFAGNVMIGETTATALGAWSITSTELADGSHMIKARQTDKLGNVSGFSHGLQVTIDTQAPSAPGRADLVATSDSGASSTDNITSDTTPTFSAKSETGATLAFLDGATVIGSIRTGEATQSFTAPILTEGQHQIRVRAFDAAGNVSALSSELAVVIDTTVAAPTRPDLKDTSDSGVSPIDNITNKNRPVFTGDAEAGATVSLFDGATVVGTGKASSAGTWSIQTTVLADGMHAIAAQAIDPAGNISAMSAALSVTIDTARPAAPSDLNLLASSDSGASASDDVTSDTTPTFRGKAEAGSVVTLTTQNGAAVTEHGTATANGAGTWTITTPTLADGFYFFKASATDAAGNRSFASADLQVRIDTTAPPPPVITRAFIQPGSALSPVLLVNGESEAGATVTLSEGGTVLGTVNSGGLWQIVSALAPGQHMLSAVAVDPAGNTSGPSVTRTVEIGTAGNDTILGTAGADFLNGWKGDDTYMVNHAGDVVTEHEFDGTDTVLASVGYTLDLDSQIEFLAAAPGAGGLALTGNNFFNTITGGAGDDVITGRGAADDLAGGLGADIFALLALSDSTVATSGRDTIRDFSVLEGDLIGLSALDANTALAGDQAFTFIGAAAFSAAGQVRAEVIGGDTIVSGNVNANLNADFAIRLTGSHVLGAANFIL
jgi:Ca2+-binding RTX toxin-like protein